MRTLTVTPTDLALRYLISAANTRDPELAAELRERAAELTRALPQVEAK